jgi:FixJ family two-component response regulator
MTFQGQVYIVDDDLAARESVAALVESMGVPARAFASAEEFLQAFDPRQRGCLVTDLRMPGMSGLELQQRLAREGSALPVVVITAFADVPVTVQIMQAGAVTVLPKPYRDQELWDAIRKALARDDERAEREARDREVASRFATLTSDERLILDRLCAGKTNKAIALELDLGQRTIEGRRSTVMAKLRVRSLAELVLLAAEARQLVSRN